MFHKNILLSMENVSEVFDFAYAEDVIEFAKSRQDIDVAILDINLPVINGIELAEKLKKLIPEIHIIFITGYPEYKSEAMENGCSGYLTKPTNADEIKKELAFVMQNMKTAAAEKVRMQCFGNFDVFINDNPVVFNLTKAKELLAYLVDRCRTDFADIQNKKECGGNRQWQRQFLRKWAAKTKGKAII